MSQASYQQPTKTIARRKALKRAVKMLTTQRRSASIAPMDYVRHVKAAVKESAQYGDVADLCLKKDVKAWEAFHHQCVGKREANELTVAYLAGPEPANDLAVLMELGVRPENIWAFESEQGVFSKALGQMKELGVRGVKLMDVDLESFFTSSPRRFDIIYVDACGPLPSPDKKTGRIISSLFRYSALAPLGVLITNFSRPDIAHEDSLNKYSRLVANYLYPKISLDTSDAGGMPIVGGATSLGYELYDYSEDAEVEGVSSIKGLEEGSEHGKNFKDAVAADFDNYYGSFITRHLIDIASIIAPTSRLLGSKLWGTLFESEKKCVEKANAMLSPPQDDEHQVDETDYASPDDDEKSVGEKSLEPSGYEVCSEPDMNSLLATLNLSGLDGIHSMEKELPDEMVRKFLKDWENQLVGFADKPKGDSVIKAFYACRSYSALWKGAMQHLTEANYGAMSWFCDVPSKELGFFPSFAQFAHPAHCNIRETRRFKYTAEGKQTTMYLDVMPFDECRYIYDWLSSPHLFASDMERQSAQLTFRFGLDAVAKAIHSYQSDFLYGSHVIPIDADGFSEHELLPREDLSAP